MTNALGIITSQRSRFQYSGRICTDDEPVQAIILHAGGYSKQVTTPLKGGSSITTPVHVGGVRIVLRGTTPADQRQLFPLRDACFWGSGGFELIQVLRGGGAIVTAKRCKHCAGPMIDYASCEWSTCGTCALVCEHTYIRGAIHGGGVDIGVGFFCDKCGRGKPKENDQVALSLDMHHMAVQAELGVHVVEAPSMNEAVKEATRRVFSPPPPNE
jgi:hypothetical protein